MNIARSDSTTVYVAPPLEGARSWQRLFHRWFVEYNPLYLLSATLVLAGYILTAAALCLRALAPAFPAAPEPARADAQERAGASPYRMGPDAPGLQDRASI